MTMPLLTVPSASGSFWRRGTCQLWSNPRICQTCPLVIFFLFPKLKGMIKGTRFPDVEAIKRTVTSELRRLPEEAFQGCIEAWKKRMDNCVRLEGNYFEGDEL